jgi:pilus assembly protein FimV
MFRDMNRLTKGVLITTLSLVVLLVVGSLAGNFYLGKRLSDAQKSQTLAASALDEVQAEYNGLYREYTDATGGEPEAATPKQVDEAVGQPPKAGNPGAAGPPGASGTRGLIGLPGQIGPAGPTGPPGSPGANGKDGASGAAGALGDPGADGKDGLNGASGAAGEKGADGATGAPGPQGPAGPEGVPGPQGEPGADGSSVTSVVCTMEGVVSYIVFYDQLGIEVGRVQAPCV